MKTFRLAATAALAMTLVGCGGGEDEAKAPAETVTVTETATATPPAPTAEPVEALDARGLIDLAAAEGMEVCPGPKDTLGPANKADESLTCDLYGKREQTFEVFSSSSLRDGALLVHEEIAGARLNTGYEPSSVMTGITDGTYWLIAAQLDELEAIARGLESEIYDFSDLDPEEPRKPPKPEGPPTQFGTGTYLVGEDVAAGLYRSGGPSPKDGRYCVVYASTKPDDLNSYLRGSTIQGPAVIEINDGEWVTAQFCEVFKRG